MRAFLRHPAGIPIEFRVAPEESPGESVPGPGHDAEDLSVTALVDVGFGGLRFRSQEHVEPERTVWLRVPSVQPDFEVRARVAWCRAVEPSRPETPGDERADSTSPAAPGPQRGAQLYDVGVAFLGHRDAWRTRLVEQACHIEAYRRDVAEREGRELDREQAAREWIERFAADFPQL